jgi:hypothetical protein
MPGGMGGQMGGLNPTDMKAAQDLLGGKSADATQPGTLPGLGGGTTLGPNGLPIGFPKK